MQLLREDVADDVRTCPGINCVKPISHDHGLMFPSHLPKQNARISVILGADTRGSALEAHATIHVAARVPEHISDTFPVAL